MAVAGEGRRVTGTQGGSIWRFGSSHAYKKAIVHQLVLCQELHKIVRSEEEGE